MEDKTAEQNGGQEQYFKHPMDATNSVSMQ
uniref:Uncharacterized protein n=1 Tax=Rhizophora mucronata TaxID=61149 RepID=A0A2P2Q8D6_RHIMU